MSAPVSIEQRLNALEKEVADNKRKLRTTWAVAVIGILTAFTLGYNREAVAQGYGVTLAQLATRMTAVETKTQFFTTNGSAASGGNLYVVNANLHIRDGSGDTEGVVNGRGNLIIGYNEAGGTFGDERTGGATTSWSALFMITRRMAVLLPGMQTASAGLSQASSGDKATRQAVKEPP